MFGGVGKERQKPPLRWAPISIDLVLSNHDKVGSGCVRLRGIEFKMKVLLRGQPANLKSQQSVTPACIQLGCCFELRLDILWAAHETDRLHDVSKAQKDQTKYLEHPTSAYV